MGKQYQITKAASFLYNLGVNFWETGVIKQAGISLFDYYKTDKITKEQKERILDWCKDAKFMTTQSQYTPEIVKPIICFPKAGFYKIKESGNG